jgi:NADH-quinone oxidoreductase subunit M
MSVLNLIILLPIVAAIAVLLGAPARKTSLAAAWASLAATVFALMKFDRAGEAFQFKSALSVLPDWGLSYSVGADGLSLMMLLLTTLVLVAAVWVTPSGLRNESQFYACVLLLAAGALGAFASLDLFFFYAFHELALIPTFLLIGIWGSGDKYAAAWKITIYLAVGSFFLLIGLIGLYLMPPASERTFDLLKLQELAATPGKFDMTHASGVYLLLLLGFGVLISLFPFHTWAPQAYASAPAPAAMLHAGVLKKFGLYGIIRVAMPLLPEQARAWAGLLTVLLLGNILYVGLVTIGQKRLDQMLGYSSVMHMGYIFLGLVAFNAIGVSGAVTLMFAHGLSIAALFAITGMVRQRTETLEFAELGGLAKCAPYLGLCFGLAGFASIGLPGFGNFASEILVFFGAFKNAGQGAHFSPTQIATILALWGVVISAVYMLRAYRAVFMGEASSRCLGVVCVRGPVRWALVLLLAALLAAGFFPQYLLDLVSPAVNAAVAMK